MQEWQKWRVTGDRQHLVLKSSCTYCLKSRLFLQ